MKTWPHRGEKTLLEDMCVDIGSVKVLDDVHVFGFEARRKWDYGEEKLTNIALGRRKLKATDFAYQAISADI